MIIDLILDRKDGKESSAKEFYNNVAQYGEIGDDIAQALDGGENEDVRRALNNYIDGNDYNEEIKKFINSQDWLNN